MFEERDKELIYSIQLGDKENNVEWYWSEELYGDYTVKNAYKLLQVESNRWNASDNKSIWRKVWRLNVPAKCDTEVICVSIDSFMTWFERVLECRKDKVDLVAAVCWGIWKAQAKGIKEALRWIKQKMEEGWSLEIEQPASFVVESDCQVVVFAINI
ncbi:hypothetical protein POM88_046569 [Heracleum sosnowskyi]|uniref:Uncharacterized protein n=1 Tax=Heracleum sosnowskyi TaxID=360622 RepID=A0AAD8H9P8_9APIA|nr:hypothetical protein POM88_046569 [Heracleum sosnowskyi]